MLRRRNFLLFLAGAAIALVTSVCGFGAVENSAPAPAATVDLSAPSGLGGIPEATTSSSETLMPALMLPSPTAGALLESPPVVLPTGEPSTEAAPIAPPPAIPESRRLTLEYPPRMRAGDSDVVRLTLEVDSLGNLMPTAEIQGNLVTGQTVQIPNLYDTHNVIADARLDLAGAEVRPGEEISEPLLPGQSVTFYWSVHPASTGTYRGTAWLILRFIDKVTKDETQKAVAAQSVEITAGNLLGISGNVARAAGGLGSLVGAVLGFPFVDEVLKFLWNRLRHRA